MTNEEQPDGRKHQLHRGVRNDRCTRWADLQGTNLQAAYLAARTRGVSLQLERADFYRADLSGASLKGASAKGAVFYRARLRDTVLRDADLREAIFFEADLSGADFGRARLEGASFAGARNIPIELVSHLEDGNRYRSPDPAPSPGVPKVRSRCVFLSAPSARTPAQDSKCARLAELLASEGLVLETLPRRDYHRRMPCPRSPAA
jgi:hypothetical protein